MPDMLILRPTTRLPDMGFESLLNPEDSEDHQVQQEPRVGRLPGAMWTKHTLATYRILSTYLYAHLSIQSINLSINVSIYQSINLSIYLSNQSI